MNIKDMEYEYTTRKEVFLSEVKTMTEAKFNYELGALNTLAGYTGNLKDYVENILRPAEMKRLNLTPAEYYTYK